MPHNIRISEQLEKSTAAGSVVVTDVNNKQAYLPPGVEGQDLKINNSGVPEYQYPELYAANPLLQPNNATTINDCDDLADWTIAGAGTGALVTQDGLHMGNAIELTTDGANGILTADLIGLTPIDLNDNDVRLHITIEAATIQEPGDIDEVTLYATHNAFGDFALRKFLPSTNTSQYFQNNVKRVYTLKKEYFTETGTPDWSIIDRLRVRVRDNNISFKVRLDKIELLPRPTKAKIVVMFDDGFETDYTEAKPVLDRWNIRGTSSVVAGRIDTAGYMSTDQIKHLARSGWDINTHGDINLETLTTDDEISNELLKNKQAVIEAGTSGRADTYAFPNGGFGDIDGIIDNNMRKYFTSGRTIYEKDPEVFPVDDPYRIRQFRVITADIAVATVKADLQKVIDAKGVGFLVFHRILTPTAPGTPQYTPTDYADVIDNTLGPAILAGDAEAITYSDLIEQQNNLANQTPVSLTATDVGLGNVDNTSDADKPVSTAQQTALDAKVDLAGDTMTGDLSLGANSLTAANQITVGPTGAGPTYTQTIRIRDGGVVGLIDNFNSGIRVRALSTADAMIHNASGQGYTVNSAGLNFFSGTGMNVNTQLINNVVDPVAAQDAATKNYVDTRYTTGTGTITTGTDTVTITHLLGSTPSFVSVTFSDRGDTTTEEVTAIGATTFVVTIDANAVTDANFIWKADK